MALLPREAVILKDRHRDVGLALLLKAVDGHVGVYPEDIGLEPPDGRTPANHKDKFRTRRARTNSYIYILLCLGQHVIGINCLPGLSRWTHQKPPRLGSRH